jgi:NodT family efflux transporter outer membrane factor (OMF) lipoprotein
MRVAIALVVLIAALAGCTTVGPDYRRPGVAGANGGWIDAPPMPTMVDARWWEALHDPLLDSLVAMAAERNLDVRETQARLLEARASRDAGGPRALPQIDAKGSATKNESSANGQIPIDRIPGFARRISLFDTGFDASWELDLWGRVRRSVEGASARNTAAEARVADVRLQTIAETVRTYGDLRAAQERLASLRADLEIRQALVALVEQRYKAGESARSKVYNAAQRAAVARAAIAGISADVRGAMLRLALLCGQEPKALVEKLSAPVALPTPPAIVAIGIRSELLRRRADVRAAEADLAAASADIGVEKANLYPRFSLVDSIGQQAQGLGALGSASSSRYQFGPGFSWPIFAAGRIQAQVRGAGARFNAAAARYGKVVLSALSDSESAVKRYEATQSALRERLQALKQAAMETALTERSFRAGEDDRLALLEAQSVHLTARQQATAARADSLASYVALAKALGGGWSSPGREMVR